MRNSFNDLEHLQLVARRIAEGGVDITREYKDWMEVTFACASLGEAARESYHTICSQYSGYKREECDKKFDNCLRTGRGDFSIGTVLQKARDAGVDTSLPRGRRKKSEGQKREEKRAVVVEVKEFLMDGRQWRYNTLSNKTEFTKDGVRWDEVDDRFIDTILTRLREAGLRVKDNEVRSLIHSSDFAPDYAPHLEWLNNLPTWNPEKDPDHIHDFFVGHMEFGPMADVDMYDQMFHRWLVGVVALWRGEIDANPMMPSFCGPEHVGKSFFAEHVLPPCLLQYQTTVRPNDPFNTDTMLTLSEVLLVIFDEISISSDAKSNMMKYLITLGQTNLRDAYGHYRKARRRIASPIATTNHHQFIRESEGSRRYLSIDLVGTKNIYEHPLNYEGAYAQALYLLNHGFEPKPTYEESKRINQHNKQFMIPNDCVEALQTFVRQPKMGDEVKALTAGDLLHELSAHGFRGNAFNSVNIGKAMKSMGFEPIVLRGYTKYRVVLADYTRREREQKEDAILPVEDADTPEQQAEGQEQILPLES